MDKNAIKKFAIWARTELISRVAQRALKYGIEEGKDIDKRMTSFHDYVFSNTEISQRNKLISKIEEQGYQNVIEEIAYTWFNRFCAIRFMEVNGYLPSHVRVFSDDDNNFDPQIIHEAINLDFVNAEKVYELREANKNEELYRYLLISQCNELSKILPGMFQKISDYTELLLPDYLLRDESVLKAMVEQIPQDDWKEQVQILGWMYQYYIAEPKDVLINAHKTYKNDEIPFVTQIFTSDWIVRFMVENSLGRLWVEGHGKPANSKWEYYLDESEQDDTIKPQLEEVRKKYKDIKPEDIRCIDPCSGSGHILCYMFDVLIQIYEDFGYSAREAAELIIKNNLYGLDISERAGQLAYFAVMMKARQYDRRFFADNKAKVQPHIYVIPESNYIDKQSINHLKEIYESSIIDSLVEKTKDAKTYGSLIKFENYDYSLIRESIEKAKESLFDMTEIERLVDVAEVLSMSYDVVITNPPYMNASYMPANLKKYIQTNYSDYKSDLFSAFIIRALEMCKLEGHIGLLTPYVWMFISSYEKLRNDLLTQASISSMVQLEYNAFEGACVPVGTFTLRKSNIKSTGEYIKLSDFKGIEVQAPKTIEAVKNRKCGYRFTANQENFSKIPGSPVAYWVSENFINAFDNKKLNDFGYSFQGMITGDNNYFLRLWYENDYQKFYKTLENSQMSKYSGIWVPYNKGGGFRRWYGNNEYTLRWVNNGTSLTRARTENRDYYFRAGVTWSFLTSSKFSCRYFDEGYLWDVAGSSVFSNSHLSNYYICCFMNSIVAQEMFDITNPTINFQVQNIINLPIKYDKDRCPEIEDYGKNNIEMCKVDWNSFETSWDFVKHPLVNRESTIAKSFTKWSSECDHRFNKLKSNEEELNRIFIDIYGLNDELTPEVDDKDVTVRKADLTRDIKSFISYAVGCLLGRYSLEVDGLAYAGGEWDSSKYKSIIPDADNIIPICDDEYFEDDLTGLFINFLKVVYGEETLEENLKFIADTLGGKGTPREIIRKYFLNDFFADHCKIYQKRPIYWLFDSGKKNGFKCLIYMHRYQKDTIAKIRTDYVHEQQARYRTEIESLETRIDSASASESVKLKKKLQAMKDQAEEILAFEEKVHHLADQMIEIDLDDGVKNNYEIFKDVLAKIK